MMNGMALDVVAQSPELAPGFATIEDLLPAVVEMVGNRLGVDPAETSMALEIVVALMEQRRQVAEWEAERAALEREPRCCGWTHVREDGRVYAHHGKGSYCPYPTHETDGNASRGLRKYVSEAEQAAVTKAMATWNAWEVAGRQAYAARRQLQRTQSALEKAWRERNR